MKNAIWRSRAVAILGFMTLVLVIFPSLPSQLKATLFAVFGFLLMNIGLIGSRRQAYVEVSDKAESIKNNLEREGADEMISEIAENNLDN